MNPLISRLIKSSGKVRAIFAALLLSVIFSCFSPSAYASENENPKREFRGAWLHVIGQSQWRKMTPAQQRKYISDQFSKLQAAGCNAVIFQVRPMADAVYKSDLEPWSYWLTGQRGKAPSEDWDPMAYAIEEAHRRGMEFHAWLNPYRVSTNVIKETLPADHMSRKEPHRFFNYNGMVLFDPAYQENRDFICKVVKDIVSRYDVDAIHIDDYFYPYPVAGKEIPDADSYAKFGKGMNRKDWRRHNVDLLVEQLHNTIKSTKPWVRFGVSPFGIWRNKRTDPRGSQSTGLQNYDDLYADVLLWDEKGWVDYFVPQLYWELDTKAAPSRLLAKWWNDNIKNGDLYIGQDTKRTMDKADPANHDTNELDTKVRLTRILPKIGGNVWWHGYWVTDNYKGVADSLARKYQSTIALPPAYGDKSQHPQGVKNVRLVRENGKTFLTWTPPAVAGKEKATDAVRYVVYEFYPGEDHNIDDSQTIIALTPFCKVLIADNTDPKSVKGLTFCVTALDRMNRESSPATYTVEK